MFESLGKTITQYYDAKKTLSKIIQEQLNACYQEIFDKYPIVETFAWRQYTPYFNDGEECTFGVNTEPDINGKDSYDCEKGSDEAKASDDVESLLESIPTEIMEDIFGNHVEVTVNRDGTVEISAYDDHD